MLGARAELLASRLNLHVSTTADDIERLLRFCLVEAPYAPTVEELAGATGFSYRTLVRRLEENGLPDPKHCLQLGQLLLLEDAQSCTGLSTEEYSKWIGFADERPLEAAAAHRVGSSVGQINVPTDSTELVSFFRATAQRLRTPTAPATNPTAPDNP
jgi:hypothetical protein